MKRLDVELGPRSYPIFFGAESPNAKVAEIAASLAGGRANSCLLVTDDNVGLLYGSSMVQALQGVGLNVHTFEFPAGEEAKILETVGRGMDFALRRGIRRSDFVVALGGGVVGDMAGLMAALLHRGLPIIQVPTTLLAQIDSSVGGKTGVNHATGKNLIGTFWQPHAVVASQEVLKTLEARQVRSGLSEGLKHALIRSPSLLAWMRREAPALLSLERDAIGRLVRECCEIKAAVVAEDERDEGIRAILNFGHTLGHGFEVAAGYGVLTHGEAVALGMVLEGRLSAVLGVGTLKTAATIELALKELGLPNVPFSGAYATIDEVVEAARSDKKGDGTEISFILLAKVGEPLIRDLNWRQIRNALGDCETLRGTEDRQ